ncbi:uncharacterized protein [Triticum aestivum]|uniref:uncharacterized protein isoform X2 n=1 Tax=Triticum aestivum TaxID=4565 RepID=UPI001D02A9A9|nr:uncharacterized protein LOC123061418 isoform X2 [Triticum aestivum]
MHKVLIPLVLPDYQGMSRAARDEKSGASRRKGSRDSDGQNNPVEAARGSSRQITIKREKQRKGPMEEFGEEQGLHHLASRKGRPCHHLASPGPHAPVSSLEAGFRELRLQGRMNVQVCSIKCFSTFDG